MDILSLDFEGWAWCRFFGKRIYTTNLKNNMEVAQLQTIQNRIVKLLQFCLQAVINIYKMI